MELFDKFPYLENESIIIRKMEEKDVEALEEITSNENIYQYISPFLFKKSRKSLLTAIQNLGGRDFDKKKGIIAGIYLKASPQKMIGLAEMFDYKKKMSRITIGYRVNEKYWNQGIASNAICLMRDYLTGAAGIQTLQAYVMPANIYSAKALLKSGFRKEEKLVEEKNWGGQDTVMVEQFTFNRF